MPVVVNSNASATSASFNLSRANDSLRKSLERLSSGNRINSSADDAGGLAVAYKLNSKLNRTEAVIQNSQNALSYLQVQDSGLQTVGKILDRMAELRVMAQDITKNSSDIENYSKEFVELQSQLKQIKQEKFNGISLFSQEQTAAATGSLVEQSTTIGNDTFDKFGRILTTHPNGESASGSISLNVVNLQYVLSIGTLAVQTGGTDKDLGGTMRLGSYEAKLKKGSLISKIYNSNKINERHRHRYEVNINFKEEFEKKGMIFSGLSPDLKLPEIIELKNHPWFIGVQFHPEFKSRPLAPHPLFSSFIKAAKTKSNK